jgi:hypothetical protein
LFRILLDQNVTIHLREFLLDHEVLHSAQLGWSKLSNGDLIAAAERDGFDIMITGDKNLAYQQNLRDRRIAIVVLSSNYWPTLREQAGRVVDAVRDIVAGDFVEVAIEEPRKRRWLRPPPGPRC